MSVTKKTYAAIEANIMNNMMKSWMCHTNILIKDVEKDTKTINYKS